MYTTPQINTILTTAARTLYRLQNQSERDRYMSGDSSSKEQPLIIHSLYNSVAWGLSKSLTTSDFYAQVAYLYWKCEKALAGLGGVTNPDNTPPAVVTPNPTQVYLWEFFVPATTSDNIPVAGDTVWVNTNFVNRTVEVEYGGIPVPGIQTNDGSIYFLKPYSSNTLRFWNLPGGLTQGALLKVRAFAS
jgi:hypothetical protein